MTYAIYEGSMGINSKSKVRDGFASLEVAKEAFVSWMEEVGHQIVDIEKDPDADAYDCLVVRKGGYDTATFSIESMQ